MANRDELVSKFADVTGVEAERALFYLESSAWQLEVRRHIYKKKKLLKSSRFFSRESRNSPAKFVAIARHQFYNLAVRTC